MKINGFPKMTSNITFPRDPILIIGKQKKKRTKVRFRVQDHQMIESLGLQEERIRAFIDHSKDRFQIQIPNLKILS
jgi:hypothetical protein